MEGQTPCIPSCSTLAIVICAMAVRVYASGSNHVMCRAKLWRAATPEQAPVAQDVDWGALGQGYQLAGGSIKQAVVRAATQAVLRLEVTPPRAASACLCSFCAMFSACTFSGHCEHQGCSVGVCLRSYLQVCTVGHVAKGSSL